MLIKRILSLALVFIMLCGMLTAVAAGTAGTATDPLISKSYIDGTYPGLVLTGPLNNLTEAMTVLKYKLSQAGQTKASGVSYTTATPDSSVSLSAGSGFQLVFGSARLDSCSGSFLDLSDGTEIAAGQSLTAGHRYLAAENTTASVKVITGAKLALYGSASVSAGSAPSFTDVTEDKWFYTYVCYAVNKGLVNGRSATIYDPDANLSIAEAIKLAACMNQLYSAGSVTLANDPTLWYKSYLDYAVNKGIVTKVYKSYDAAITRSEFVSIFYAALPSSEYTQINTVIDNSIPDVKLTSAYAAQIYAFYRAGILIGSDSKGSFNPATSIKRSEVSTILTRMFEKDSRASIALY